ncbi:hypothetical protein NFI96_006729 [Prochilodus magdalenae]|nr:hypothetical protein NFI96_006729 [Prochilodus magdalenae]
MPSMNHPVSGSGDDCPYHHVSLSRDCSGVVPDCHGVTQNGSGSSSVTSPALVLVETPNESVCGGTVVSTKMDVFFCCHIIQQGLVSLHLHPYHTICRNCVRMFKLHGMDYHRTPLGTSTAPYRDVWRVGWTVRDDSSSAAAQCSAGHPLVLSQWAQDAAHRTLPTGRCPQDAAHRTLPTGHSLLPWTTVSQSPVPIQFQTSPVLAASGSNAVFTLQTITNTFSIAWIAPGGSTLGQWVGGQAVLNSVPQYQGRVTITATQLTIGSSQLSDAGNYTVTVVPTATTGLSTNSLAVALRVFGKSYTHHQQNSCTQKEVWECGGVGKEDKDVVGQVSLFVPSVAIEGGNVSLRCSWTKGTETNVAWGKGGSSLATDSRITINGGSLIINPAKRSDAGEYSCTVSNPISAQTATASLTVYYGPDPPQLTKTSSQCVGGGDATVGQTVKLTCTSASLPPALLSWQYNGNLLTGSQADGTLDLQVFSTNQSGQYVCTARNGITTGTSQQQISLSVVGESGFLTSIGAPV